MDKESKPTKKFINRHQDVVPEALEGLCMLNKNIRRIEGTQIITLKTPRKGVNIICGGGSGHEPAHTGYVCEGILSAAVCGGVFSSPSYQDVLKAIVQVANENGVLLVIKNYTGDRINFELAADIARTKGIPVETLLVADDVSLEEGQGVGRRGLAGTVLLYKILGHAANEMSLKELHSLGQKLLKRIYTIGASLTACSVPGYPPMYMLPDDEMEIGLGIHGEKGLKRTKLTACDELVEELIAKFTGLLPKNAQIVLMVNNLGSCTELEMTIIARAALRSLKAKGVKVMRVIVGKIMTSLEMHGFSLTVLDLEESLKELVLKCLDEPAEIWKAVEPNEELTVALKQEIKSIISDKIAQKVTEKGEKFKKVLEKVFNELKSKEGYYNQLDAEVGDGDLGMGVAKTSDLVLKNLEYFPWEENLVESFNEMGEIMAQGFGGTTGPLYAFFFLKGSQKLEKNLKDNTMKNWYEAFKEGFNAIKSVGKAELGDRTMLDTIGPALQAFGNEISKGNADSNSVAKIVAKAANKGAEDASNLKAKRGRSSYLQGKEIGKKDPGCELAKDWIELIAGSISELH